MSEYKATCFNPTTQKTATSMVTDFEAAKIRARTLRVDEPLADREKCVLKVVEPDGTTWEWRKVLTQHFWKKSNS